jgi:ABC-type branched-subunit amino acid transport system ATPase component
VLENARLAAQSRDPRPLAVFADARRDPRSLARAMRGLELAGLVASLERTAGALSHGEQRQLEIAMVLATDPEVLLLDEPLAGMGADESARIVAMLQRLASTHAILLVEHDMDAVFALADVITVMVNGQVLESVRPRRSARARRSSAPISVMTSMRDVILEASALHSYYGASHVLRGVDFAVREGEAVGLMGRNGMGKTTLIRTMLGIVVRAERHRARARPRHAGMADVPDRAARDRVRARGTRHLPEPVGAREPRDGRAAGARRPPRLDRRARARDLSRASPSGSVTAARSCRAASSRC